MHFVTPKLAPTYLCNNTVENIPLVNTEAYGYLHQKYHHHSLIETIQGAGLFCHNKLI